MNHARRNDYFDASGAAAVAVVNNALAAHIGFLGSLENIARAKGENLRRPEGCGIAVFNADSAHADCGANSMRARCMLDFGLTPAAAIHGRYRPTDSARC